MIYRPVRERSLETIASLVDKGLAATGFEELSFLSLSTGRLLGPGKPFLPVRRKMPPRTRSPSPCRPFGPAP
jgi:hypothetical protein